MQGDAQIIEALNDVLTAELTAINQYFVHSKMCGSWGYEKLAEKKHQESIGEMKDADALIERILYLEGVPNVQRLGEINIGETVKEQLEADLALEHKALARLNEGLVICRKHGDHASEELLQRILVDEEKHTDWIETQLGLIERLGEQLYLAQQVTAG